MVRALLNGQMAESTKENSKMTRSMEWESSCGKMAGDTKESGKWVNSMVSVYSKMKKAQNLEKVNGLTAKELDGFLMMNTRKCFQDTEKRI